MLPDELQAEIRLIRADNTSGAVDLVRRAAEALREAGDDPAVVQEFCRTAVAAQPAMAPLVNLANAVLFGLDQAESPGDTCDQFLVQLSAAGEQISGHFVDLIEDGMTLLTHSSSRTVLDALRAARGARKGLKVICTESRPMGEGIALARLLSEGGLDVKVVTDASAWRVMEQVELAICGTDSITSSGLVNKTGTALVALAARESGRPLYALCGSQKFLPVDYSPPPELQHSASEIAGEERPGVEVDNLYFESVPLELIHRVITEAGVLTPQELRGLLPRGLHPALLNRTSSSASHPPCA